ncbi:hypothetical protein BKK41_17395 [Bacillus cereus]|uniref:Uncharacterized protein n=1 Tax=Bacillus paranthracis TaxID=2026186 RepID=A0A9X8SRC8_9BACI|nr:hypothetical protein BKK41_17395 [Bacillus cereus]SME52288.1 hypothetical protein BACERE00221_05360 [Bacillus paranthracis]
MDRFIRLVDSNMVKIPAGKVELRNDRIKKEWKAQVNSFLLAKCVVTMELYDTITNRTSNLSKDKNKPVVIYIDDLGFRLAKSI